MTNPLFNSICDLLTQTNLKRVQLKESKDMDFNCTFDNKTEQTVNINSKDETNIQKLVKMLVENQIQEVYIEGHQRNYPGTTTIRFRKFGCPDYSWEDAVQDVKQMTSRSFFHLGTTLPCTGLISNALYQGQLFCQINKKDRHHDFEKLEILYHKGIEKIHDVDYDNEFVYFTTDQRSSMWKRNLSQNQKMKMLLEVLPALEHMRDNKICHGAIHEENIVFVKDQCVLAWLMVGDEECERDTVQKDDYFRSPFRNEIPNDPRNDFWQFTWIVTKTLFDLQQEDFGSFGTFKYPNGTAADNKLMETELGRQLKKMLIDLPEKADYKILMPIIFNAC